MKTCRKCGIDKPATLEFFYKHNASSSWLTPRCKVCVNVDNKEVADRAFALDPDAVRAKARARAAKSYRKNIEVNRERGRAFARLARSDERKREVINARKRAGGAKVTPEELQRLLEAQQGACAFCRTKNPEIYPRSRGDGWHLDHCHRTGAIRFILCSPCNRGLAAFRESPTVMRRAAALMEDMYGNE